MSKGWIKLHRGLLNWEWYDDSNTCRLFIHCLLRANHAEKTWRGMKISRGQFYTSLESLASETGLSVRMVRTSLDKLTSTGELTSKGHARGRMITVSNYDSYQDDDKVCDTERAGYRQGSDKVATTNKNEKNYKNEKEVVPFELLVKITELWNTHMSGISPSVDLTKKNKVSEKRIKLVKAIMKNDWRTIEYPDSDYTDADYWEGYIIRLATSPLFDWQRNNGQLKFDQAFNFDKFTRNLESMRMAQ